MKQPNKRAVAGRAVLAVLCAGALCGPLTACKDSDALKEIIYDQSSDNIDYKNPNKIYLSDETAEETSDLIPSAEVSEDGAVTVERQNLMVYSSSPNTQGYVAKQSLWAAEPDFEGIEASSGVHFVRSDDPTATEQPLPEEKIEEVQEEEEPEDELLQAVGGGDESSDQGGAAPVADSVETTPEESDNGASDGGEEEAPQAEADGGDAAGDKTNDDADKDDGEEETKPEPPRKLPVTSGNVNLDTTDPTEDPLPAAAVAAYGDAAVMVEMLGGKGALAAADASLLKTDFAKVVDEGLDLATGWSGDGTEKGSIKADAIIKSGADTVLVYSSDEIGKDDFKKLNDAGVAVQQIYPNTNTSNIKRNAATIAAMLADGETERAQDPTAMAEKYTAFLDDTIAAACKKANGSETAVAGSKVLEKSNDDYAGSGEAKYTLVMDDYNANALYSKSFGDWSPACKGALLATMGVSTSATSFYVQAGGLVNTAAVKGASSGKIIAWQFNTNIVTFKKNAWSGLTADTVFPSGSGYELTLFTLTRSSTGQAEGNFGSEVFPKVIVGSQTAASAFINNSKKANGIYHPYGYVSMGEGLGGYFGPAETDDLVFSTIGVDGEANVFGDAIPEDAVAVCPTGLFSSWIEGTSPESFLMAAWVNDEVNDDSGDVDWEDRVTDFYRTFYRCDLSSGQLSIIEQGAE